MKINNVLLLYKKSAYKTFILGKNKSLKNSNRVFLSKEMKRLKDAHDCHYEALDEIVRILKKNKIGFTRTYRGKNTDFNRFDFVFTVGGDGTFLETARNLTSQVIVGVNSVPYLSVGNFCAARRDNFEEILKKIINDDVKVSYLHRLKLQLNNHREKINALNDILVCHANPAMLCRYYLKIGSTIEEQRSSGLWVSTPSGSTGAIKSAGGKVMNKFSRAFQYKPRELYQGLFKKYSLTGGILSSKESIEITSIMPKGRIYVDGAHHSYPFNYGDTATIKLSNTPIKTVALR